MDEFMLIGFGWAGVLYERPAQWGTEFVVVVKYRDGIGKCNEAHPFIFLTSAQAFIETMDSTWGEVDVS